MRRYFRFSDCTHSHSLRQSLDSLRLLSHPRVVDLAIDGPKVKDTIKLIANGEQMILYLTNLVGLVVLDNVCLDLKNPSVLHIYRSKLIPRR